MSYEVTVTALGGVCAQVFNAIATLFSTETPGDLITIISALAFIITACQFVATRNHQYLVSWVFVLLLVPTLLIFPKMDLVIIDKSDPMRYHNVQNVPVGIGYPAFLISSVSQGLQTGIEKIFHTVSDKAYQKTGMLYGAELFTKTSNAPVTPELQNYWSDYLYQCIRPDVDVRHKYTYRDLFHAPNIFQFLKDHGSGGTFSRVPMKDKLPNCTEALVEIEKLFKSNAELAYLSIGASLGVSSKNPEKLNKMKAEIQSAYAGYFRPLSQDANMTMMQNLGINATKNAIATMGARKNATAAALNYAKTQNDMASTTQYYTIGVQMQKWIPMAQTILFLLICCAGIPVLFMLFLPGTTLNILRNYMSGFVWICSWGIFFVFINFIMNTILELYAGDLTELDGGFSLANSNPLKALAWEYASLTGYFLMFVPVLSKMVFTGASNVMTSMVNTMGHNISSNANLGSRAISTGDYNLFNTSVDNHNLNSLSAHKHDTNRTNMHGEVTSNAPDGTIVSQKQDGSQVFNNAPALSNMTFGANIAKNAIQGFRSSAATNERLAADDLEQSSKNMGAAVSGVLSHSNTSSFKTLECRSEVDSKIYQYTDAVNKLKGMTEKYGEDAVHQVIGSLSGGIQISGSVPLGSKGSLGGSLGYTETFTDINGKTIAIDATDQQQINESWSAIKSSAQNLTLATDDTEGKDYMTGINSNLTQADNYLKSSQRHKALSLDDNKVADYAEQNQVTLSQNLMQPVMSGLREKLPDSDSYFSNVEKQNTPEFKAALHSEINNQSDQIKATYLQQYKELKSDTTDAINQKADSSILSPRDISQKDQLNQKVINNEREMEGLQAQGQPLMSRSTEKPNYRTGYTGIVGGKGINVDIDLFAKEFHTGGIQPNKPLSRFDQAEKLFKNTIQSQQADITSGHNQLRSKINTAVKGNPDKASIGELMSRLSYPNMDKLEKNNQPKGDKK